MYEIGHGIDVYYEKMDHHVLFANGRHISCHVGDMIFEINRSDAVYLMYEKPANMIRCFPNYKVPLTLESLTDGFRWIYGAVDEEEDLPFATELFRSEFNAAIMHLLNRDGIESYVCVGDFLLACNRRVQESLEAFETYMHAITLHNSGLSEDNVEERYREFEEVTKDWLDTYSRKCRKRTKGENVELAVYNISSALQLLIFEHSRMVKLNKRMKVCLNCDSLFIPDRSNQKYCMRPAPQNPKQKCIDIASTIRSHDKRRNDSAAAEHNKIAARWGMASKRAQDQGDSTDYFKMKLYEEHERYRNELKERRIDSDE